MNTKIAIAGALTALSLAAAGPSFATNQGEKAGGSAMSPPGAASTTQGEGGNNRGPGTPGQHGSQSENTTSTPGTTGTTQRGTMGSSSTSGGQHDANQNSKMPSNSPGKGTSTGSGGAAGTSGTVGGNSK